MNASAGQSGQVASHDFTFSINSPDDVSWRARINQQMRLKPGFPDNTAFYVPLGQNQLSREKIDWNQKTFATGSMNIPWPTVRYLPKRPDIQNENPETGFKPVTSKTRPHPDKKANKQQYNKTQQLNQ
jgi:hypothetical protein